MEGESEDWGSLPHCSPREPPFSCQTLTGTPRHPAPAVPTPGSPKPGRGSSSRSPRPRGGLKPSSLERHPAALLVPFSSHAPAGALAVRQDSPRLPQGLLPRQAYALPPSASTASEAARRHPVKDATCPLAGPFEQIVLCVRLRSCISGSPLLLSITSHMTFISDTWLSCSVFGFDTHLMWSWPWDSFRCSHPGSYPTWPPIRIIWGAVKKDTWVWSPSQGPPRGSQVQLCSENLCGGCSAPPKTKQTRLHLNVLFSRLSINIQEGVVVGTPGSI